MDAVKLVTEGPPAGKEHRTPELYFDNVLEGSCIVAGQCSKDVILNEVIHIVAPCIVKQVRLCNIMFV